MTDILAQVEQQIEEKRAELAELETTAKVLRRLAGNGQVPEPVKNVPVPVAPRQQGPTPTGSELAGKDVREAAIAVLTGGKALHYKVVATEAIRRGYRSGRGTGAETAARTFWATMKRLSDVFQRAGAGKFKLRTEEKVAVSQP